MANVRRLLTASASSFGDINFFLSLFYSREISLLYYYNFLGKSILKKVTESLKY